MIDKRSLLLEEREKEKHETKDSAGSYVISPTPNPTPREPQHDPRRTNKRKGRLLGTVHDPKMLTEEEITKKQVGKKRERVLLAEALPIVRCPGLLSCRCCRKVQKRL